MYVQNNIKTHSYNYCCSRKAISVTEPECVCVCVCVCSLRYPARKVHAPCHLRPAPLYTAFSTLFCKRHNFRKKVLEHKKVFFRVYLQILSEIFFFILRRIDGDEMKNVYWSSCKVADILVRF